MCTHACVCSYYRICVSHGVHKQVCNDSVDLYELVKKTNCELGDTFGSIITVYMKYFDSLDLFQTKK